MTIPPKHTTPEQHKPKACVLCPQPVVDAFRPFCSHRCRLVDLNRWLSGVYTLPLQTDEEDPVPPAPAQEHP